MSDAAENIEAIIAKCRAVRAEAWALARRVGDDEAAARAAEIDERLSEIERRAQALRRH